MLQTVDVAIHWIDFCAIIDLNGFLFRKLKNWWKSRDNIREDFSKMSQWERDYDLVETSEQGLFYEYLEMGKLFVAII